MKKADVETRYDHGNYTPTIEVKWNPWPADMVRKFKDVRKRSKFICRTCERSGRNGRHDEREIDHEFRPGGLYHVHEFGDISDPDIAAFWRWFEGWEDDSSAFDYPRGPFSIAEQISREDGWELAQDEANFVWENTRWSPKVYSDGRSGGWLIVNDLPPVDEWDLMDLNRWARFRKCIQFVLEDRDHQFVWHAYVNVYENWMRSIA